MTNPLAVGTKVKIVSETMFHCGNYVGSVGTIDSVYPKNECAVLFAGFPYSIVFRNDEIEVIDDGR